MSPRAHICTRAIVALGLTLTACGPTSSGAVDAAATDPGPDADPDRPGWADANTTDVDPNGDPPCDPGCVFPVADHVAITHPVWGEDDVHFYVPSPTWAMAATHASRLLAYFLGGALDHTVSPNWFLSTALKESYLGCCTDTLADATHAAQWEHRPAAVLDGCFQIENGTAFVEMQRIFPDHYGATTHAAVIGGCHVESSAVSMAFYDAFAFGMMFALVDDPVALFAVAADPGAVELVFSIAYNRGVWSTELATAIGPCAADPDLLACVFGAETPIARDHADAIWHYVQDLDGAAREGACYDGPLTSQNVADYAAAVAPLIAPTDVDGLRDRAVDAFELAAGGATGTFQAHFGAVLEVLEAEPVQDPFPQLAAWYSVSPAVDPPAYSWPPIDETCDTIGPIP